MKKTFYLIRHAESESNTNPLHIGESYLTDVGVDQSLKLAEQFKNVQVDNILTSTVTRAQMTASQLEHLFGIKRSCHNCLKERKGLYSPDLEFDPTEEFDIFKSRLIETKDLLENSSGKHIVVISHAIFIKAFISKLLLGDLETETDICRISSGLIIDHAKVSKLIFDTDKLGWKILSLNGKV